MTREPIKTDPDGLAEVWRAAEQRRAEDISGWFSQLFERRRSNSPTMRPPLPKDIRRWVQRGHHRLDGSGKHALPSRRG
jgi:hypothetical protein